MDAIWCSEHPASANLLAAALRRPCGERPAGNSAFVRDTADYVDIAKYGDVTDETTARIEADSQLVSSIYGKGQADPQGIGLYINVLTKGPNYWDSTSN